MTSQDETSGLPHSRLQRLPKHSQWLLQYAACLGPTQFSISILEMVWMAAPESKLEDRSIVEMRPLLLNCEKESFIEKCNGGEEYQWKDDKIREMAFNLNSSRTTEFQFRAGMAMLSELSVEELEPKVFMVADLVNHHKTKKSEDLASLNLRAARKSSDLLDFVSASVYAAKGISMLPSGKRLTSTLLALELYTIGAQIEMMLGNAERVESYTNDSLKLDVWSVIESMPVRLARAMTRATVEKKYDECIDECLLLLKQLGCKLCFSRRFASPQAVWNQSKTIKAVKKKTRAFFEELLPITDERYKAMVVLLCLINNAAYHTQEISLAVLCTCKSIEISMNHGLHYFSEPSMAALGDLDGHSTTSSEFHDIASMLQLKQRDHGEDAYRWYASEWTKPFSPFAKDNS